MMFPLFASFPAEIHSLILESCPPNDRTCLSLTCKYLYDLAPLKHIPSLEATDTGPLCCENVGLDWSSRWTHRRNCHKISYEAICKRNEQLGRSTPEMTRKCRTRYASNHCECFTRRSRLHLRLKSWMPKGMNYCGECGKFTKRKRQHNGRCYHGHPKERKCEPKYWTHTSRRGAFGRKIWKKWFNNRAMNRLESRLQQETQMNERQGSGRYSMRQLEGRKVDTKLERDNKSSYF